MATLQLIYLHRERNLGKGVVECLFMRSEGISYKILPIVKQNINKQPCSSGCLCLYSPGMQNLCCLEDPTIAEILK